TGSPSVRESLPEPVEHAREVEVAVWPVGDGGLAGTRHVDYRDPGAQHLRCGQRQAVELYLPGVHAAEREHDRRVVRDTGRREQVCRRLRAAAAEVDIDQVALEPGTVAVRGLRGQEVGAELVVIGVTVGAVS